MLTGKFLEFFYENIGCFSFFSTIVVEPGCTAEITKKGNIEIAVGEAKIKVVGTELDAIQLSIFSHRFMSIAEQMGRILQRTAISTNIKVS